MKMNEKDSSSGFQLWGFSQRLGRKGAASQNLECRQWLGSSHSLGAPSRGGSVHRPQSLCFICSCTQSSLLAPWLVCSFICSLFCLYICSSVCLLAHSLIHSLFIHLARTRCLFWTRSMPDTRPLETIQTQGLPSKRIKT